jgi:hypothetical protein
VSAYMPGRDSGDDRLVQRWQVYEVVREESP